MLKSIELVGFKSFGKKTELAFASRVSAIVGPNGSGKSNVAEAFRFVLGEQSMKSLRSKKGEDLIWGGSPALPRGNRASVKVTFDNSRRQLDIDFPEVVIERAVFRDGVNEYSINGSQVRLKDVIRLLAGANIGGSGYQIISQGEADRILSASPRERREMIEDALGLKLYQHKKIESERKLKETKENQEKVEGLRRELGPHLNFLRKQVEKIEKAKELTAEFSEKLTDYLAREHSYLDQMHAHLQQKLASEKQEIALIDEEIARAKEKIQVKTQSSDSYEHIERLERELERVRTLREEAARALGRAEGELSAAEHLVKNVQGDNSPIPREKVRVHVQRAQEALAIALGAPELDAVKSALGNAAHALKELEDITNSGAPVQDPGVESAIRDARRRVEESRHVLHDAETREKSQREALVRARQEVEAKKDASHEAEIHISHLETSRTEARGRAYGTERSITELGVEREAFNTEVREAVALLGGNARGWESAHIPHGALSEDRSVQRERRRALERLKIKLEEFGGREQDEVVKEFNSTKERDAFLARELTDLEHSAKQLEEIIKELDGKIDADFQKGLVRINSAFKQFFTELFSGGDAELFLEAPEKKETVDEDGEIIEETSDEAPVQGLAVSVQLPRKKVRGLEVLSGGERALTSIALIFAMSQVNPPPFIILDETDAALDEANSRRYAEIVKVLSKHSQLILITHNRATMAAAGELYGVTMGHDGISRLLSVKLEEAERVAK